MDHAALEQTLTAARRRLLAARVTAGHWVGELSSSALSTATAVCALELLHRAGDRDLSELVRSGLTWLAEHQNEDGGWGDTIDSPSNLSTTTLCWAALGVNENLAKLHQRTVKRAEGWLKREAGDLMPRGIADAIGNVYGDDRTFSAPILTMCALAGRLGSGREAWRHVTALPFELAACPHGWLRRLGLPVVSYALPALIAIGQVRHHHRPPGNPLTRLLRRLTRATTLRVLETIQPESGGFLEAAPLTSFVLMSLVGIGLADHPAARRAAAFLAASVREDGSWPIDTNLTTWVTTLSVNALASRGRLGAYLSADERADLRRFLLDQQYQTEHPYTHAAPGGWAWTPLSGGVPDADDTAGALLALWHLAHTGAASSLINEDLRRGAENGIRWLLDLQNKDGGVPTFCRGWGKLVFDRSTPDLTAHALRAWNTWREHVSDDLGQCVDRATRAAIRHLLSVQRPDACWVPLWFGNQQHPTHENPLYGTTRVLLAGRFRSADDTIHAPWLDALRRAGRWVLNAQNQDGGWGAAGSIASSIEETALAVEALACPTDASVPSGEAADAITRGVSWLIERTACGERFEPVPIGLYFARLWYAERLYPLIFTVSALERVRRLQDARR
jgi:squalene-hopene/tetraprenyl-beta-curcumene cyclase